MDLNYIVAARLGHIDMLHAIFGKPEEDNPGETDATKLLRKKQREFRGAPPQSAPPITPQAFDDMFLDRNKGKTI